MRRSAIVLALLLVGLVALSAEAYRADLEYVGDTSGVSSGCFPRGIRLVQEPLAGIDWPEPEGEPYYGALQFGDGIHAILVDRVEDRFNLYVDIDATGELVWLAWDRFLPDGSLLASVAFSISYEGSDPLPYQMFLIWSSFTPTILSYCRDHYRTGTVELEDGEYLIAVLDEDSDGRYDTLENGTLIIDSDGDGNLLTTSDSHEVFSLDEPFNIHGVVYEVAEVSPDGTWIEFALSESDVAEKLPLLVGFEAPDFTGESADGETLTLSGLRGEIVVLDFWAGWCGPCVFELPTMNRMHRDLAADGVVILGINLDRSEAAFEEAVAEYEIPYAQIFDGSSGPLADLYRIIGIPMTYVIDPEGIIVARGLTGANLRAAVEGLLETSTEETE